MKTITTLLFCLPFFCMAQNKKDNTIIIHDTISSKEIKQVLFSEGYDLNRSDSDFISTQPKYLKGLSIKISLQKIDSIWVVKAFGKDNVANTVFLPGVEMEFAQVYCGGMKGSSLRDLWNEFDRVVKQISTKLEYTTVK